MRSKSLDFDFVRSLRTEREPSVPISVRFSGQWAHLWQRLTETTGLAPSELIKEALHTLAVMEGRRSDGSYAVNATVEIENETVDVREHFKICGYRPSPRKKR